MFAGPFPEPCRHRLPFAFGSLAIGQGDRQLHQPTERGRPEPAAQRELLGVEGFAVAARHGADHRVVGLVRLQDGPARPIAAARPPDGLAQELVRPFGRPFVGQVERDIGRHDADERDGRHVEALGDETRADQDVRLARRERVQHARGRSPSFRHVPVQPRDPQGWVARADLALHPFRATAEVPDPWRTA